MNKRNKELLILKICIFIVAAAAIILAALTALSLWGKLHYNFHVVPCIAVIVLLVFALIPYVKLRRKQSEENDGD